MKKLISAVLALTMMLSLAACGRSNDNNVNNNVTNNDSAVNENAGGNANAGGEETPDVIAAPDLTQFYQDYMASLGEDNTPMMMSADPDTLEAFYTGLGSIALKQSVVELAAMSAVAFEFALVEVENAEDVETVKTIFQNRVDTQVDGGAWYPETIASWEKAEIIVNGNVVALIVAGEQQADAVAAFNALFA